MSRGLGILVTLILFAPLCAFGQFSVERPNWDARLAIQTANVPAGQSRLEELFALQRTADYTELERRLNAVITGTSLSQPARDSVLFRFAVGLAESDHVDPAIIERLRSVKPSVLVPHEERAHFGVPLFDIAGAAEGVYQLGLRRAAREEASRAASGSSGEWLNGYLRATTAQRNGYRDALGDVTTTALRGILDAALKRLPASEGLTPVAGKSALILGDRGALERVVRFGSGGELSVILEAAGLTLDTEDALVLLQSAVTEAPASNAALAIAQLYPRLASRPAATEMLLDLLPSADLGGAAALALAGAGGPEVRASLIEIAERGPEPAATRARTALSLRTGEGR